ncbi:PIR Superfamily Protein [Plasmodium ovale curtisi]|uniref:PIR Superfamily Protein n=1 Tax=Plasmodium ovale curtisi TaxID=864141 RepID=A0A1A8WQU7_PLAOA|nr:PIR Superfamily Protein [Plasmodium ovale curtisi]
MSPSYKDQYFDYFGKNYEFLNNLPLYFIYSSFYMPNSDIGYETSYCMRIIKNKDKHSSYIRSVCHGVQAMLSYLKVMVQNGNLNDINKGCAYLNYLIHDKIKHIISSSINIEDLYESISNSEHTLYAKYFGECSKYYYQILQDEYCKKDKVYKNELNDFQKTFNKTKNFLKEKRITLSIDDLQSPEEYNCSTGVLQPAPITRGKGIIDTVMSDSFSGESSSYQDSGNGTPHINVSNITGIISGSLLGTFALFLMSYKYTPFGPWLRKKKDVANNLFNNNEIGNHELLINNSENENINLDEQLYHIKYYSAENS